MLESLVGSVSPRDIGVFAADWIELVPDRFVTDPDRFGPDPDTLFFFPEVLLFITDRFVVAALAGRDVDLSNGVR